MSRLVACSSCWQMLAQVEGSPAAETGGLAALLLFRRRQTGSDFCFGLFLQGSVGSARLLGPAARPETGPEPVFPAQLQVHLTEKCVTQRTFNSRFSSKLRLWRPRPLEHLLQAQM